MAADICDELGLAARGIAGRLDREPRDTRMDADT